MRGGPKIKKNKARHSRHFFSCSGSGLALGWVTFTEQHDSKRLDHVQHVSMQWHTDTHTDLSTKFIT